MHDLFNLILKTILPENINYLLLLNFDLTNSSQTCSVYETTTQRRPVKNKPRRRRKQTLRAHVKQFRTAEISDFAAKASMPIDQKRINGPEGSLPYQIFGSTRDKAFQDRLEDVLDPTTGNRKCNRQDTESRKYCKF